MTFLFATRFEKQRNMQTSNADKFGRSNDPVWQFLGEYPLSEFLSDHDKGGELTTGFLFKTVREWGIPLEYLENIDRTLTGFAKEALVHFKQGSLELPGRICVFCQKKMIDNAISAKTSRPDHAELTKEQSSLKYHSSTITNGGWGYFIIERTGHVAGSSEKARPVIDLYLYKEGE